MGSPVLPSSLGGRQVAERSLEGLVAGRPRHGACESGTGGGVFVAASRLLAQVANQSLVFVTALEVMWGKLYLFPLMVKTIVINWK